MKLSNLFSAALAAAVLSSPAFAADISIEDPYARSSGAHAKAGAAFMTIVNTGEEDDRLISASSDVAPRVELHTHIDAGNGVMQMREVEDGIIIPANGSHSLQRGGDHVMFMGLSQGFVHGESVTVTLTFENADDVVVDIPVDLERQAGHGMDHGAGHGMQHGTQTSE